MRIRGCLAICLMLSGLHLMGQADEKMPELCSDVITTLVPQRVFQVPTQKLPRVELRSCEPGVSETLQIAAWERSASRPSLVVETSRSTIVQLAMSSNVFVIHSAGGSSDGLQVVVFNQGKPHLALEKYLRAAITIRLERDEVIVETREETKTSVFKFSKDERSLGF